MEDDVYTRFTLTWQERDIEVAYQSHWLGSEMWHIELRCDARLPLTETGNRSCLLQRSDIALEDKVRALVVSWLDEAAQTKAWKSYLEDSRQLKMF